MVYIIYIYLYLYNFFRFIKKANLNKAHTSSSIAEIPVNLKTFTFGRLDMFAKIEYVIKSTWKHCYSKKKNIGLLPKKC